MEQNGRFKVVTDLPQIALGSGCAISRTSVPGDKYLDIDFKVDNETPDGWMFVREAVVLEWAELFGCLRPSRVVELESELEVLRVENKLLTQRAEVAENVVHELRSMDRAKAL